MYEKDENNRNQEFLTLTKAHADLLIEFEKLKNATVVTQQTSQNSLEGDKSGNFDEKLSKLKKKVIQEKKKYEKLLQEKDQMEALHSEQVNKYIFSYFIYLTK